MSKVFKASNVTLDASNKFFIDSQNHTVLSNFKNDGADLKFQTADEFENESGEEIILRRAKREAEKIIKKAEVQAAITLADAVAQSETMRKEMLEKSHKEGYENGYAKGMAEADAIKQEAQNICSDAENEREKILEDIEPQIVELVLAITSKLLSDTAEINPQVVINLIKQGIVESTITGDIKIRVSPDDFETVAEHREDILSLVGGGTDIDILKDFSLNKLDCIIETPFGNIDCSLDQRFEALKNNIYYIFENR